MLPSQTFLAFVSFSELDWLAVYSLLKALELRPYDYIKWSDSEVSSASMTPFRLYL